MSIVDFERLYAADPDPWRVATDWYEQRKIDLVLACLRRERYPVAWDAGCGTGELSARLADRCEAVFATDASVRAVALTGARCSANPQVTAVASALPGRPEVVPEGAVDLVVLSEVLYYLPPQALAATAEVVRAACAPGADVLAVHWTARPEDAHASGLACHRELDRYLLSSDFGRLVAHRDVEFTLTLWSRDVPETVGR